MMIFMPWTQRRILWIGSLVAAYGISAFLWSGVTLYPPFIPYALFYAPTGLLRLLGMPVSLIPDARPEAIFSILPWIHAVFWPALILILLRLQKMAPKTARGLYLGFIALLLVDLAGCTAVAGRLNWPEFADRPSKAKPPEFQIRVSTSASRSSEPERR